MSAAMLTSFLPGRRPTIRRTVAERFAVGEGRHSEIVRRPRDVLPLLRLHDQGSELDLEPALGAPLRRCVSDLVVRQLLGEYQVDRPPMPRLVLSSAAGADDLDPLRRRRHPSNPPNAASI